MATVTMDIAELDKLRQEIKEITEKRQALEKEINDVKSDKRVIIRYLTPKKDMFTYSFDYSRFEYLKRSHPHTAGYNSYHIESILKDCISIHPIKSDDTQTPEFVNFEDAKEELRAQLEEKYKNELVDLRHSAQTHADVLRRLHKEHQTDRENLLKDHDEVVKGYIDKLAEELKRYEELETDKKELTEIQWLKQNLKELQIELEKEKQKSWWSKLLGR